MARDFATAPDSALLLSPDNRSRHELDAATRAQLRQTGKLTEASFNASVLLPRQDVTGADRQRAASYRPGDTVWYRAGSREKKIAAKSYTQVVSVDTENNLLTVRKQNGVYQTYDPARLQGVSVYQSAERSFSVGDRIQFLQKWDAKGVNTRDRATITRLDRHGNISVRTEDGGKTIRWNLSQNKHIDYAYAMTSHSAQAATVDRALLHIDTGDPRLRAALDQTTFSVSLSRARYDAHVYTDSIENLARTLSHKNENTQALSPEQVSEYRQSIPTPERSQERTLRPELQRERSPSQGLELAL
jgi:hypothetical protein